MDSAPVTVTVHLEPRDYPRFVDFATKDQKKLNWRGLALLMTALLMLLSTSYLKDGASSSQTKLLAIISLVMLVFFGTGILLYIVARKQLRDPERARKSNPGFFLPSTYTVTEDGLFGQNDNGQTVDRWHSVSRFTETETDFFVMLAEHRGHILPKRFFPTPEAAATFAAQVRANLEKYAPAAIAPA